MRVLLAIITIAALYAAPACAQRTVRPVNPPLEYFEIDTTIDVFPISPVRISVLGDDVLLTWQPLRSRHPQGGPALTGYAVYSGETAADASLLALTAQPHYTDLDAAFDPHGFYRVTAYYSGEKSITRRPQAVQLDEQVLLDFEADSLDLLPFSEEEDVDPDEWGITDEESLPGSEHSLHLSGNTWKRLSFQRTDLTDTTVWSIGILSVDGDTMGEQQAFGLGDGVNQLFYAFHGKTMRWAEAWVISGQDARARGRWEIYQLPVGYDWRIRYGYLPSIDELYFINDNDDTDPPAEIYYDQLLDITTDILPEPDVKMRWNLNRNLEVPGTAVEFLGYVDNRGLEGITFSWDFGDGTFSSDQNPLHVYQTHGVYTVGLAAFDDNGRTGYASGVVSIGEVRLVQRFTAAFTGDVMLARRYENNDGLITRFGPEYVFDMIRTKLAGSDLTVINLECPLTDEGQPHPMKGYVFRGRPGNVAGLVYAGVDIATLANNHVSDYGDRGLEETSEVLDAAGIVYCGAGMNLEEALQPTFKTVNGVRVGVLAYCNRTGRDYNYRPFLDAGYDKSGYAYFSADNLIASVPEAADQCDLLVVAAHGGTEYEIAPMGVDPFEVYPHWHDERIKFSASVDSAMRELEHLAIDLGAGLVIGHHPHVLQGFEVYRGVLIAHSLGNFAFDQNFWETWPSAIVWTDITRNGVEKAWIEPVFVDNYRPTPAVGFLGKKLIDRLAGYSRELNATLVPEYHAMRASIVFDQQRLESREQEHVASGRMRFIEEEQLYRSEPIRLDGGGFTSFITSLDPPAHDPGWELSLGREILLVGGMEPEGAAVWNYNSNYEGRDQEIQRSGRFSSYLHRLQGWRDGITDLKQRIPVDWENDRLTFSGWLRITNGRDAGLAARYYRFRYDDRPENITGEQVVERRLQGDQDWTYLWDQLVIPENTDFLNVRWQMFGPQAGDGWLWADDLEVIRWEEFQSFEGDLRLVMPNDLYYLQVQTRMPVDSVTVTYRTTTLHLH